MTETTNFDPALAESNAKCLDAMTRYAVKLHNARDIDHVAWAESLKYIRINGGGLRPISICNDNPCGALAGYPDSQEEVDNKLRAGLQAPAMSLSPDGNKPELRLQARLIEHAIRSPETLSELLHLRDQCDELRLVTDELKVNNVRADVLLLGKKDGVYFPVFIELKNDRQLHRLREQLVNIVKYVGEHEAARCAFAKFAMARVEEDGPFDFDKRIEIIIWPALADPSRAPARTCELLNGRHVLEFPDGWPRQPLPRMGLKFTKQVYLRRDSLGT